MGKPTLTCLSSWDCEEVGWVRSDIKVRINVEVLKSKSNLQEWEVVLLLLLSFDLIKSC